MDDTECSASSRVPMGTGWEEGVEEAGILRFEVVCGGCGAYSVISPSFLLGRDRSTEEIIHPGVTDWIV